MEHWVEIIGFPRYEVSDQGRVRRTAPNGRLLKVYPNQYGVATVGLMQDGVQRNRSVALLVARAFLLQSVPEAFDTPINLNGDRLDNRAINLTWRPRWFARSYHRQFRIEYEGRISRPIRDVETGAISQNSLMCAVEYGLLEKDIVLSILNNTVTWPTFQRFELIEN